MCYLQRMKWGFDLPTFWCSQQQLIESCRLERRLEKSVLLLVATILITILCKGLRELTKYTIQITYTVLALCAIFLGIVIKVRKNRKVQDFLHCSLVFARWQHYNVSYFETRNTFYGTCICPCLLYTSPSPRDGLLSRMPSSA